MIDSSPEKTESIPLVCHLVVKARKASGKTTRDCATMLGISHKRYLQIESGKIIPSLPEIEMLAYYFDLQPEHFFQDEEVDFSPAHVNCEQMQQMVQLRHRIISASLQLARTQKKISIKDLSNQTGIATSKIKRYELTAQPIPLNDLKAICASLKIPLQNLLDQSSFLADYQKAKQEKNYFESLPNSLRDFISTPSNQPFLVLAMRLKETGIENIEGLANGLQQLAERAKK